MQSPFAQKKSVWVWWKEDQADLAVAHIEHKHVPEASAQNWYRSASNVDKYQNQ